MVTAATGSPKRHDTPALAALSGEQLAGMLPTRGDFPTGWGLDEPPGRVPTCPLGGRPFVGCGPEPSDAFGYDNTFNTGEHDCSALTGDSLTGYAAASVVGHAGVYSDPVWEKVVQVQISRDFHPATLDELAALASRCSQFQFTNGDDRYTVTVLDNPRPDGLFRYVSTRAITGQAPQTSYYSYTQLSGLVVAGYTNTNQQLMNNLVDLTLGRIRAR